MNNQNFVSFEDFAAHKYFALSDAMQAYYGSCERFIELYVATTGFGDWMETLRDRTLEAWQMDSIARTYFHRGHRSTEEVRDALAFLARQYQVELPLIEGCLTVNYWDAVAAKDCWYELYRPSQAAA